MDYTLPGGLAGTIRERISELEESIGHEFGSSADPLLVSVRSGARISMPGMMDTILNLGINDEIVEGLGAMMGDRRPAWDAYRRFVQIYAEVVQEVVAGSHSRNAWPNTRRSAGVELDFQLTAEQLAGSNRRLQGDCPAVGPVSYKRRPSGRPVGAALRRGGGCVPELEQLRGPSSTASSTGLTTTWARP